MLYACVAYSETYQIKSETIKGIYLNVLEQMNFESYTVEDIQNKLENEDMNLDYVTTVIIDPNNNIYFSNEDATQLNNVEYYSYYTIKYKDFLVMNNVFDNLVYESTMSNKQIICIREQKLGACPRFQGSHFLRSSENHLPAFRDRLSGTHCRNNRST